MNNRDVKNGSVNVCFDHNLNLDDVFALLPAHIYWKDTCGKILGCNLSQLQALGLACVDEIIGKTAYDFLSKEEADRITAVDRDVIEQGVMKSIEIPTILSDGSKAILLAKKVPIKNEKKETVGLVGISVDITKQKILEQKLACEKEKAIASDREKSKLLLTMDADINTPLSSIVGMSELLFSKVEKDDERDLAQYLLIASRKLLAYFGNCLAVAKFQDTPIKLEDDIFDFRDILCEMHEFIDSSIKLKGLDFTFEYDENIPCDLLGDSDAVKRILMNLLDNAVKFTHVGSIDLHVSLSQQSDSQHPAIEIILDDTGIGIPEGKRQHVFEKFSRLFPGNQSSYEGAGMGLYVVERLVRAMGGQISVGDGSAGGTRFTAVLPLKLPVPEGEEAALDDKFSSNVKARILLVEDNQMVQRITRVVLTSLGHEVDVADCGEQALDLFEPGRYDLVYMDIGLPDMSGCSVSKIFRKMEYGSGCHVCILAVTAHASTEVKAFCLDTGMDGVLNKPLTIEQCKKSIKKYVAGDSTEDECAVFTNVSAAPDSHITRIIDFDEGAKIAGGNQEFAQAMMHDLYISLADSLTEMNTAFELGDMGLLNKAVHKFHGGLCYAGVPSLRQAVLALQALLKTEKHDNVSLVYGALLDQISAFRKAYRQLESLS